MVVIAFTRLANINGMASRGIKPVATFADGHQQIRLSLNCTYSSVKLPRTKTAQNICNAKPVMQRAEKNSSAQHAGPSMCFRRNKKNAI